MFIGACECGKRVFNTRTGPGHGCVLSVRCCAAAYLSGWDVRSEFILECVPHILRGCAYGTACVRAVRRLAWAAQAVYLVRVCVNVCMHSGRHEQPD